MALDPIAIVGDRIRFWNAHNFPGHGTGTFKLDKSHMVIASNEMTYGQVLPQTVTPEELDSAAWENNSSAQDSMTFTVNKSTTNSFSWSMKEGIKAGAKFKAKVPFVGESEITVELNLEATQAGTNTTAKSWTYSAQIPVPPHKRIKASFIVNQAKYSVPFTVVARVRGICYTEFDNINFLQDINSLIKDYQWNTDTFDVQSTGTLDALFGQNFFVRVDETDLVGAGRRSYVLDSGIMRDGKLVSNREQIRQDKRP
jgi:Clostridium epsilon toxin ETX/Bacillus mosquitocidal toxin MTX2